MKDEALGLHAAGEGVEALGFLGRPEGRDDEALGIAALEEGGTVDAGEDVDLGADLAERLGNAADGADADEPLGEVSVDGDLFVLNSTSLTGVTGGGADTHTRAVLLFSPAGCSVLRTRLSMSITASRSPSSSCSSAPDSRVMACASLDTRNSSSS